jgi:hypothetical protein
VNFVPKPSWVSSGLGLSCLAFVIDNFISVSSFRKQTNDVSAAGKAAWVRPVKKE